MSGLASWLFMSELCKKVGVAEPRRLRPCRHMLHLLFRLCNAQDAVLIFAHVGVYLIRMTPGWQHECVEPMISKMLRHRDRCLTYCVVCICLYVIASNTTAQSWSRSCCSKSKKAFGRGGSRLNDNQSFCTLQCSCVFTFAVHSVVRTSAKRLCR